MTKSFKEVVDDIGNVGREWHTDTLFKHVEQNTKFIKKTLRELDPPTGKKAESAIIVSAGPSLHYREILPQIKESGYEGTIVCVDGSFLKCVKAGITPDYVVTLDPHPTRMVRWFGDHDFEKNMDGDDYFSRQDLDIDFRKNTIAENQRNIDLVNEHAANTKMIICSTAPLNLVERTIEAGFDQYWWNPICDDPKDPDSMTRKFYGMNKLPCLNTGGTVGTAAWVFANSTLNIPEIAVVGMDLGYYKDLPLHMTQTIQELRDYLGEQDDSKLEGYFPKMTFPGTNDEYYTDPTYAWYKKNLLQLLERAQGKTYNCTEAGTLFGEGITCISLQKFLKGRC